MFSVSILFDLKKITGDYKSRFASAETVLGNSVLKSCEMYVPYDTGNLMRSGRVSSGGIVYYAPYAKRMYYHDGKFSKKVHRSASSAWFEHAKLTDASAWIYKVQRCISGR